jgi:hypothetical protein
MQPDNVNSRCAWRRRTTLFRQLLTEGLLLVALGGALAWVFALSATKALADSAQIDASLAPDHTVPVFTLSILVLAAELLFGLALLRVALAGGSTLALKTSSATSTHSDHLTLSASCGPLRPAHAGTRCSSSRRVSLAPSSASARSPRGRSAVHAGMVAVARPHTR